MSTSAVSPLGDSEHGWSEIEHFLAEAAELSRSDISFAEFASEMLDRITDLLAAAGGAVWTYTPDSELRLQCHIHLELLAEQGQPTGNVGVSIDASHTRFLSSVMESGEALTALPRRLQDRTGAAVNSSDYLWIACPFELDGEQRGVIEVLQQPMLNEATQRGNVKLLTMVAELTADFLRRGQLRQFRQLEDRWQQYEMLVRRVSENLDLRHTAFQLVNDGRAFIGCDRVSLVVPRRGKWKVLAISGVDTFDRRSDLVRAMEGLANVVVQSRQSLRYRGEMEELAPQLEQPLGEYIDVSHSHSMDAVLLQSSSPGGGGTEPVGVLVIEQFDGSVGAIVDDCVARVANLGSLAVRNSLDYQTLPLLSMARWARRVGRVGRLQRHKLAAATVAALLVLLALVFIPARFFVRVQGELQPLVRRDIYAPLDGEVVEVKSEHDEAVEPGQFLLSLRSRPLEVELQRLQGEYQATEKKLVAVASARVQSDAEFASANTYPGQLAAEEQELQQLLSSLQKQIDIVRQQRDELLMRSPIGGRVLTWNPRELLDDRPVQRGQLLVTLADVDGPWILELSVPDNRAGYLLAAQREQEQPLEVHFSLATDRATSYRGQVEQIAARSEVHDGQRASVKVVASVPKSAIEGPRPGAIVYAKIDCGMRSLGFVWLHDITETIKAWLLF